MTTRTIPTILAVMVLVALTSCAPAVDEEGVSSVSTEGALRFTGLVEVGRDYTAAQLQAMNTRTVESANKEGETIANSGVALSELLPAVGLDSEAAAVVFVGADGYESEVALNELQACVDCIVAIQDDGTFMNVMPGFPLNTQVRELVEVRIE